MTYNIQLVVHCAAFLFDVDMANALTVGCITNMDAVCGQHEPLMSDHLPDWKQASTRLATPWIYMQSLRKPGH
jgi:hypothetical protein